MNDWSPCGCCESPDWCRACAKCHRIERGLGNIAPLLTVPEREKQAAKAEVLRILQSAVEEAEAGRTAAIVLIEIDAAGSFRVRLDGDFRLSQVIGLLEVAKHDLLERERARPPLEDRPG